MPTLKTNTLSSSLLADIREVNRRVLGVGTNAGTAKPFGDSEAGDVWLKITSSTEITPNIRDYEVDVYTTPFAATPLNDDPLHARNSWEIEATAESAAGYECDPDATDCGAITGIDPIPDGSWVRSCGNFKIEEGGETKRVFLFTHRNDPTLVEGGG